MGGTAGKIINPASAIGDALGGGTAMQALAGNFAGVAGRVVGTDNPIGAVLGPGTALHDKEKADKKHRDRLQAFYANSSKVAQSTSKIQ